MLHVQFLKRHILSGVEPYPRKSKKNHEYVHVKVQRFNSQRLINMNVSILLLVVWSILVISGAYADVMLRMHAWLMSAVASCTTPKLTFNIGDSFGA